MDFRTGTIRNHQVDRMQKILLVSVFLLSVVSSTSLPAHGCGDKLLVLGRSLRFRTMSGTRPAGILAYAFAGTQSAEAITDPKFQSAFKKAGYQFRVVRDAEQVDVALRSGKYDLVLTDIAEVAAVEAAIQSTSSTPVLLPVMYEPTKLDLTAAERRYRYVLKVQHKGGANLSVIERALETKLEAEAKLKRDHRKAGGAL
jgi:hypothetical protein